MKKQKTIAKSGGGKNRAFYFYQKIREACFFLVRETVLRTQTPQFMQRAALKRFARRSWQMQSICRALRGVLLYEKEQDTDWCPVLFAKEQ